MLAAFALEHTDRAAISGIKHGQNVRALRIAVTAHPDWIGFEAGKDLVFGFVIHE